MYEYWTFNGLSGTNEFTDPVWFENGSSWCQGQGSSHYTPTPEYPEEYGYDYYEYSASMGKLGEGQVPLVGLVLWQRLYCVAWADTLTFKSEVLPIGTPIRFNVSISLHVSVSPELEEQGNGASTELYIYRPLDYPTFGDPFHPLHPLLSLEILDSTGYSTKTYTFHGFLGDDIGLAQYLEVGAIPDIDGGLVDVDARNTALFAINVLTPGVYYESGSGTRYPKSLRRADPLPGVLLLLLDD